MDNMEIRVEYNGVEPNWGPMASAFARAIDEALDVDGNFKDLTRAKGVGPKLAQKIILELTDKLMKTELPKSCSMKLPQNQAMTDAQSIMLSLGYDEKRIKKYFAEGENKDIWSEFNPAKIKVYYYTDDTFAVRKSPMIFAKESPDKIRRKIEESVTDVSIQKIFLRHLEENNGDPSKAFSA